jgi:hypothetical protein
VEQAVAEFVWDEAEFKRVSRKYGFSKVFLRYNLLSAVPIVIAGISLTVVGERAGWAVVGFGAVYVLYCLWFSRAVPRSLWRRTLGIKGPQRLVFTDDGVASHTDVSDKSEKWQLYKYVSERDGWYLLGRTRRIATIFVPKRSFLSPRDEAVFRSIVRAHAQASLIPNSQQDEIAILPPPTSSN